MTGDSEQRKPLSLGVSALMSWLQALASGVRELQDTASKEETQQRVALP